MWIKTVDGDYYNTDHCRHIYLDSDGDTRLCFSTSCPSIEGDHREEIITNIISGTKIMEVQ